MILDKDTIEQVRQLIKEQAQENYTSGNPRIPPHQHDGVDNLQIDASNILNLPGATPGGVDGDIQINSSGVFGTINGLNLDQTGNTRGVKSLDIQTYRSALTQVASGPSTTTIGNQNTASGYYGTAVGYLNTASGYYSTAIGKQNTSSSYAVAVGNKNVASGDDSTAAGVYNIASGKYSVAVGKSNTASNVDSVAVGIGNTSSGNNSSVFGTGSTASATDSVSVGNGISTNQSGSLLIGSNNGSAAIYLNNNRNMAFLSSTSNPNPTFGGGSGVIYIKDDVTDPTTNPTGGGILYVSAGALNYRGSGGTVTPIAPA